MSLGSERLHLWPTTKDFTRSSLDLLPTEEEIHAPLLLNSVVILSYGSEL